MKFKFDVISDLHIDHHVGNPNNDRGLLKLFNQIMPDNPSDTLLIPGDLGHHNKQISDFLHLLRDRYRVVIITLGNHEFYAFGVNSDERVRRLITQLESIGIVVLRGEIVDVDGVKIGGTHMWYDGLYAIQNYNMTIEQVHDLWKNGMNDYPYISFNPWDRIDIEKRKLDRIYDKCDIIMTHVPPFVPDNTREEFKNPSTGMFSFDGKPYFSDNIKCWVYGHTHDQFYYYIDKTMFVCNPLGYPSENVGRKIQTVEIDYDQRTTTKT